MGRLRYALIADIHANWTALQAVINDAEQQQIDAFWCLGDILGYGAQPLECLRFLRERVATERWLLGNHDAAFLNMIAPNEFNPDAQAALHLNTDALEKNPELLHWYHSEGIGRDQPRAELHQQHLFVFTHASLAKDEYVGRTKNSYLYPWKTTLLRWNGMEPLWQVYGKRARHTCLIFGHTHIPTLVIGEHQGEDRVTCRLRPFRYGSEQELYYELMLINPGSVGQPRDGDIRASYAILDTQRATITFRRVVYRIALAQAYMQRGGYPDQLRARLISTSSPIDEGALEQVYRLHEEGYDLV